MSAYAEEPDLDPRLTVFDTAERTPDGRMICRYRPCVTRGPDDEQMERWAGGWDL